MSTIEYQVKFSEENGYVQGIYSDNFFTQKALVSGISSDRGHTLLINLSTSKRSIKSLTLLAPILKANKSWSKVTVTVIPRDDFGQFIQTINSPSIYKSSPYQSKVQLEEERVCTEGFGELAGFCGIYSGMLTEEQDRRNRCNLLFADAVRLELNMDSTVMLHLGEVNELMTTPYHLIGRIPVNPQKNSIDLMSRICGPLSGVNSSSSSCKIVHLKGIFTKEVQTKHFSGTYTISEEGTNNNCLYRLSMYQMH
jgi:hypothetical protein